MPGSLEQVPENVEAQSARIRQMMLASLRARVLRNPEDLREAHFVKDLLRIFEEEAMPMAMAASGRRGPEVFCGTSAVLRAAPGEIYRGISRVNQVSKSASLEPLATDVPIRR